MPVTLSGALHVRPTSIQCIIRLSIFIETMKRLHLSRLMEKVTTASRSLRAKALYYSPTMVAGARQPIQGYMWRRNTQGNIIVSPSQVPVTLTSELEHEGILRIVL